MSQTLKEIAGTALAVVFNRYVFWARMGLGVLTLLLITGVINMEKIDVTNYAVPDEYLVVMLISAIICAFITCVALRRYLHDEAANDLIADGKIEFTYQLDYDWRYDLGTVCGFIFGIAGGLYATPALVDWLFIGAGIKTYILVAGIATFICAAIVILVLHYGIRKFWVKAQEWIAWGKAQKDALTQAATDVAETADAVKDAAATVKTATKTTNKQQLP